MTDQSLKKKYEIAISYDGHTFAFEIFKIIVNNLMLIIELYKKCFQTLAECQSGSIQRNGHVDELKQRN